MLRYSSYVTLQVLWKAQYGEYIAPLFGQIAYYGVFLKQHKQSMKYFT